MTSEEIIIEGLAGLTAGFVPKASLRGCLTGNWSLSLSIRPQGQRPDGVKKSFLLVIGNYITFSIATSCKLAAAGEINQHFKVHR
jgi:hypothetical protein